MEAVKIPQVTSGSPLREDRTKEEEVRRLKKACAEFEAIFLYTMLKTMRTTIPQGGIIGTFAGKDTYNMLMDQKVAEELSRKGDGLGLQTLLMRDLSRKNEP